MPGGGGERHHATVGVAEHHGRDGIGAGCRRRAGGDRRGVDHCEQVVDVVVEGRRRTGRAAVAAAVVEPHLGAHGPGDTEQAGGSVHRAVDEHHGGPVRKSRAGRVPVDGDAADGGPLQGTWTTRRVSVASDRVVVPATTTTRSPDRSSPRSRASRRASSVISWEVERMGARMGRAPHDIVSWRTVRSSG